MNRVTAKQLRNEVDNLNKYFPCQDGYHWQYGGDICGYQLAIAKDNGGGWFWHTDSHTARELSNIIRIIRGCHYYKELMNL